MGRRSGACSAIGSSRWSRSSASTPPRRATASTSQPAAPGARPHRALRSAAQVHQRRHPHHRGRHLWRRGPLCLARLRHLRRGRGPGHGGARRAGAGAGGGRGGAQRHGPAPAAGGAPPRAHHLPDGAGAAGRVGGAGRAGPGGGDLPPRAARPEIQPLLPAAAGGGHRPQRQRLPGAALLPAGPGPHRPLRLLLRLLLLLLPLPLRLRPALEGEAVPDLRHEQHRQLQEMTKMASRPFAKVTVCFEPEAGPHAADLVFLPARPHKPPPLPAPPALPSRLKPYPEAPYSAHFRRSEPFLSHLLGYAYSSFRVGPVTLEPTDDGMAGVATVLFQLPGGPQAPNRACLASALVTLRHNLQDYCSGSHGAGGARKGLRSHDHLTSLSL
ncbi:unnamed protein product [Lepidochelys kempii]